MLARKLAKLWEEWTGQDFPGGVENAWIHREYPGKDQRSQGAMSWSLYTIGPGRPTPVRPVFMSQWPATLCAREPKWLQTEGAWGSIEWIFDRQLVKECAVCAAEVKPLALTQLSDSGYYCPDCVRAELRAAGRISKVPDDAPGRKGTHVRCPSCGEWAHLHDETTNCFLYARFLDDEYDDRVGS